MTGQDVQPEHPPGRPVEAWRRPGFPDNLEGEKRAGTGSSGLGGKAMTGRGRTVSGAIALATAMLAASGAKAEFEICNASGDDVTVAFGYRDDGVWTSTGWWNIAKGECSIVYSYSLRDRYYYYYAEEVENGGTWGGDYVFCATDEAFTIAGDADCKSRGYDAYGFREVDVGESVRYSIDLVP